MTLEEKLTTLSAEATPGQWGGTPFRKEVAPGMFTPLMTYQVRTNLHTVTVGSENQADHEFVAALVNAWRAGQIRVRS